MPDDNTCKGCVYHERDDSHRGCIDYCWVAASGRVIRKRSDYGGDYYPRKCIHKEANTDE